MNNDIINKKIKVSKSVISQHNSSSNNNNTNNNNNSSVIKQIISSKNNKKTKLNNSNNEINQNQNHNNQNEYLFWKVFKNKYLFNLIMSNMKVNLIPWYAIYSQKFMFRQKMIEVFKYKIKRGEYIAFDGYTSSIYQEIKDDSEFYKAYFHKYSEYFEHYGKAAHQAIEGDCLIAIKVIVQEQLFIPTLNTLLKAISRHRLEIIKYLLEPQFNLKHQLTEDMICDEIFQTKDINTFKILNYFIEDIQIITGKNKLYKVIQNIYQDYFLSLAPSLYSIQTKLNVVLNICKFIYIFNIPTLSNSTSLKSTSVSESLSTLNSTPTLESASRFNLISYNEIQKLKFTNEQLESGLNNPINYYYNEESRESIIKLVDLIHNIQGFEKLFGKKFKYLYLYKSALQSLNSSISSTTATNSELYQLIKYEKLLKKSFQFGNFKLFIDGCSYFYHRNSYCYDTFELFEYCPNKETQIQFFSSLIQCYKENKFYKTIVSPSRLLHPLLEYGNLDLIKLFFKDLVELIQAESSGEFDIGEFGIIKSTEILEYLFLNHTHYFIFNKSKSKSNTFYLFGYKMVKFYNNLVKLFNYNHSYICNNSINNNNNNIINNSINSSINNNNNINNYSRCYNKIEFLVAENNLNHESDNYGLKEEFNLQDYQITNEIIKDKEKISEITEQSLIRGNNKTIIKIIDMLLFFKYDNYKEQLERIVFLVILKQSLSTLIEILDNFPNIFNSSCSDLNEDYNNENDFGCDNGSDNRNGFNNGGGIFSRHQLFNFFKNSVKLNFLKGSELLFKRIQLTKRQFLDLDKIFFNVNQTFNYLSFKYLKY